ncbi:MAG: arginine--tRNA ligase [Nitrospinota bacterium]|nr:arginine--tRNA ligase [Nitrospinota bacterium]
MKEKVRTAVKEALVNVFGEMADFETLAIAIEVPPEEKFGDFSTNAAMVCAKPLKSAPQKIAAKLLEELGKNEIFSSVTSAGPGFINMFIKPSVWHEEFKSIPDNPSEYGNGEPKSGGRIMIEFVSANPTGPLHIGHGRGAAVGDVLARLLKKAGHDVTTEYYVNDAGLQMENLGKSTYVRYRESFGESMEFPENGYKGDYIKDIAGEVVEKHGREFLDKPEAEALSFFTKYTADHILSDIKKDLDNFRVSFDNWTSEKTFHEGEKVEGVIKDLVAKGEIYESDGALWLKTTSAGDEKDRVVKRGNGATTYLAADIAYHADKYRRGFSELIDIWGADHHGYVARMKAAVKALGHDPESLKTLLIQLVNLKKGGEVVAMSTRSGEFTSLKDVVDEVGVDSARFFFLLRSYDSHLDFDIDLAKEQSSENPVYYVQYAHARICNILITARENGYAEIPPLNADLGALESEEEFRMIKKALAFPDLVADCAANLSPHPITHYLGELAGLFHKFYNLHRVVTDDKRLTNARLAMISRVRVVLANGLSILGVNAPEKM